MKKQILKSNNFLNQVHEHSGIDSLKYFLNNLLKLDPKRVLFLINSDNLNFSTLYELESLIEEHNLLEKLSPRNKLALDLCNKITSKEKIDINVMNDKDKEEIYSVLKWMLETGYMDDGKYDDFDELLDIVAIFLIKSYKDKSIIKLVSDIIFERCKKGYFNYDLIWAFFESYEREGLKHITKHLLSRNQKEVALAKKLLNFVPCVNGNYRNKIEQYEKCSNWLKENIPYLYYTGDSFQQSCNPQAYELSLEAKYLNKPVYVENGEFLSPLDEKEANILKQFKSINENDKFLLSDYSCLLHDHDVDKWTEWVLSPVFKQIDTAKKEQNYD